MKTLFRIFFVVCLTGLWRNPAIAQQDSPGMDSLPAASSEEKEDSSKVNALNALAYRSKANTFQKMAYANTALSLAKQIHFKRGEAASCFLLALFSGDEKNIIPAIQYALSALEIYETLKDYTGIASSHLILQGSYREAQDYQHAFMHAFIGEKIAESKNIKGVLVFPGHRLAPLFLGEIGQTYILNNQPDSAMPYIQRSIQQNELFYAAKWGFPFYLLATIQQMKGEYVPALANYRLAVQLAILNKNAHDTLQVYSGMSSLFIKTGAWDSSLFYAHSVAVNWKPAISEFKNLLEALNNLAAVYQLKGQKDSALKYLDLHYKLKDSIFSVEKAKQIEGITFNEQLKQHQVAAEQMQYKNRIQVYIFTGSLLVLFLIAGLLIRNNSQKQKANAVLQHQKQKVESTLSELTSTQALLIQSEKMASLGELTAGIAHEIQNPLNFINNFSEVNKELLLELKEEIQKGKLEEANTIADDVIGNEEKISHHGKRADSIVKGMLLHSRESKGQKEPADMNALAEEYLRLAYHGLRSKDNALNVTMHTDFDKSIGSINIITQDMGRVLLNLYNNAFYAVAEKKKQQPENYEPTVSVSTKKFGNQVNITIGDNGNGIPQNVIDKIFQPFFTTKPTGQGTGLGLSLAYDIIKAHNGELLVNSREGEFTEFIIQLPV